jgi:hypothetical protein
LPEKIDVIDNSIDSTKIDNTGKKFNMKEKFKRFDDSQSLIFANQRRSSRIIKFQSKE